MAAVTKRGSNLRFVTDPDLLEDEGIVMAACQQDASAIQYVPEGSMLRKNLLKRKNLETILTNGGGNILQFASKHNQMDDELILLAVENGLSDISNLAGLIKQRKSFLNKILKLKSNLFLNLPSNLKADKELALAALSSESLDETTADSIVSCIPALLKETEPMLCIAKKGYYTALKSSSKEIRDNKSIMIAACSVNSECLSIASSRLQRDPDVVRAALKSSTPISGFIFKCYIFKLPGDFFTQNVDIAELVINVYGEYDYLRLSNHLPKQLFYKRDIFLAWIRKEREIMYMDSYAYMSLFDFCHNRYENDSEVLLALIKIAPKTLEWASRCKRSCRTFTRQAIKVDSRVIVYANEDLRHDFDMLLLAIGSSRLCLQAFKHREEETFLQLVNFALKVRERVGVANIFILNFLRGITVDKTPRVAPKKRCLLPRLDCGQETCIHFKRLIAEYAGVPMGHKLKMLRSALANLEFWGY